MPKRTLRSVLVVAALASVLPFAACGSASKAAGTGDPGTITIGVIPSEQQTDLSETYDKVSKVLEKDTGEKVSFYQATSYAAVIEAQRAGKVQVAEYGPFSYVLAKDSGVPTSLIGYSAANASDPGSYRSVLSVKAGSPIKSVADLKGKKVCFVDPASTSGYLYPTAAIIKAGLNPKKDIKQVMAGGHDASVLSLASGQCDAAFSTQDMAEKQLIQTGQIKKGELTQIWTSEPIPPSPWTVSTNIDKSIQQKIRNAFLTELNVPALTKAGDCSEGAAKSCGLPGAPTWGYKSVDDATYDGIRNVCKGTVAETCKSAG